ncbi:hypothetical protein N300_09427, partial [Calypte anna]
ILILASEVLAAHPSLVSAAVLVSIPLILGLSKTKVSRHGPGAKARQPPRNVGNTFPRLLNSKVEQKEDTGGRAPFSVIFLAQEKKIIMR